MISRFLRQRAERLREIAGTHRTPLSSQLRRMADELDKRADEDGSIPRLIRRRHLPSPYCCLVFRRH